MKLRQPDTNNANPVRAVTFDCWGTLIHERNTAEGYALRVSAVREAAARGGLDVDDSLARSALDVAWRRHWELWCDGVGSGPREIAAWALHELQVDEVGLTEELGTALARVSLETDVVALEGAAKTLDKLEALGVRRALICDTGFSPGHVVRQLLDRVGMLNALEVQIFSDEAGLPKPHRDVFHAALAPLGVDARDAVHVGDLRHTDIRGARAVGMGTIRINDHHDDQSALPDADAVAESHAELCTILGLT